ncbi:MAG TPA: hypothetical protein VGD98_14475 [Ktedonobacteraceae bacterium]
MPRFNEPAIEEDSCVLTYEEAYQRAWEAAEQLEELMGQYSDEPYVRDEARVASFASDCLSLLSNQAMIICDKNE